MRGTLLAGAWLASGLIGIGTAWAAEPPAPAAGAFKLTSPDFAAGGKLAEAQAFNGFGCNGKNSSPALSWTGTPAGTKSFALLVHDPDAPTNSGWWHWTVYNIPPDTTSLAADAGDPHNHLMPAGAVQGRTDFGNPGYGGPCPPPGKPHHYIFRLYALKVAKLELPADATAALISYQARTQALSSAELTGLYGR